MSTAKDAGVGAVGSTQYTRTSGCVLIAGVAADDTASSHGGLVCSFVITEQIYQSYELV